MSDEIEAMPWWDSLPTWAKWAVGILFGPILCGIVLASALTLHFWYYHERGK